MLTSLPRWAAIVVLLVALSMLVAGLRWFPYYVRLCVGIAAWIGGTMLARAMHVTDWYVALLTALICVALIWPLAKHMGPVVVGFVAACGIGTMTSDGLEMGNFWIAFALGLFGGVALTVVASRFTLAVFCAACGTLAAVASLGAVVRARDGWLAPGGFTEYPILFVVVGAVLFVGGMIAQVALEPDVPETGR